MRKTARPQRKDLFKELISDLGPTSGKSKFSPKLKMILVATKSSEPFFTQSHPFRGENLV